MSKVKRKAVVDKEYCVACGTCVKACPLKIINIEQGVFAKINYEKCVGCGKCSKSCPASVIVYAFFTAFRQYLFRREPYKSFIGCSRYD